MLFPMEPRYKAAILRQYHKQISRYPVIRSEVEAFLRDKEDPLSLCLCYLYGHMAAQDVLSGSPEGFAGYVQATLEACEKLDYLKNVPPEIFFPYVLYHRVNSECLDRSRSFFLAELLPLVQGKTMEQAALAVNYWCYAHATYTPADDRTLGPLAVLRRTLGRCGEESVLAVSALRSVGIPARQCYCPRWSHCDDNHAWVEVWIDGVWHYLGACEPEPVLDRGWFTAAASRAMLVDSKCWADWAQDRLYKTVNCTARYTQARLLTVLVTENGIPVPGARVRFQVVNYSELFSLWETDTDEQGLARFETGPGDLLVSALHRDKVALGKADLRKQDCLTLELGEAFPAYLEADLVPPEDSSGTVPFREDPGHNALLRRCEAHLAARRAAFAGSQGYLRQAAGNAPDVRAFLEDRRYPLSRKETVLDTLRPKDFVDITRDVLEDALETAWAVEGQYPPDVFRDYILAPRIADEMLLPERKKIRALLPEGFSAPGEILVWMQTHLERLPDEGICNYWPSAYACLRCRQVPGFAFDLVFVALCRAFCFPARLEPHRKEAQWLDHRGVWQDIRPAKEPVRLTLEVPPGKTLRYSEHLTLGLWDGDDFRTLQHPDLILEGSHTFSVPPGLYRITATIRQIDGTASAALWHLRLSGDRHLVITPPEDQTAHRLKQIPLDLPEGPLKALLDESPRRKILLMFTEPGSEPTEHLLVELLDCAGSFRDPGYRMLLFTDTPEGLAHPTVKRLTEVLPEVEVLEFRDPDGLAALYRQMQVGDLRLPFVVCTDRQRNGLYASANYRVGLARTLLEILML